MGAVLVLAGVLAAVFVLGCLFYVVTHLRFRVAYAPTEIHQVRTPDGHVLHLYRHRRDVTRPGEVPGAPVLCLHGLGASHFNFDFPGTADVAGYLAEQGHDVFVAAYRGDWDSLLPEGPWTGHCFDDHVRHDLPAILDAVLSISGAEQAHLVGHSMGGLLCYALVAVHGERGIASITTLGSPVGFAEKGAVAMELMWAGWLIKRLRRLHVRLLAQLAAPFLGILIGARLLRRQFNPDHVDMRYVRRAIWHSLGHISAGLLQQFSDWILNDRFCSLDGSVDYRDGLRRMSVPLLVIAGAADRMCRPENALRAMELAGTTDKQSLVLGCACGCRHDYGHIDLIFGSWAQEEVFPHVQSFLRRVDGSCVVAPAANVRQPPGPWVQ